MRRMVRFGIGSVVFCLCIVLFSSVSFAKHSQDVLGESTSLSEVEFPGLASGPGFILPDSVLYPLDQFVQEVRLLLAFTPEQQASVHMRIAGERLAEVKVMMNRNENVGIATALSSFEREVMKASQSLSDAAAKGRENTDLARSMNLTLSEYHSVLTAVDPQAPEALVLKLGAANEVVLLAKVAVEDQLPEDELAAAIDTNLENEIDSEVLGVQNAADKLQKKLLKLDERASKEAEKQLQRELQASKSALRKDLVEQKRQLIREYQERKKKLQEERKQLLAQIKVLMQSLKSNQKALQQLQQAQNSLNSGVLPSITPTVTPTQ